MCQNVLVETKSDPKTNVSLTSKQKAKMRKIASGLKKIGKEAELVNQRFHDSKNDAAADENMVCNTSDAHHTASHTEVKAEENSKTHEHEFCEWLNIETARSNERNVKAGKWPEEKSKSTLRSAQRSR